MYSENLINAIFESIAKVRIGGKLGVSNKEFRLCCIVSIEYLRECRAIKMDKRDENGTEESNQEREENPREETINVITCKDLNPFFEQTDRSINKVHFSEVNK